MVAGVQLCKRAIAWSWLIELMNEAIVATDPRCAGAFEHECALGGRSRDVRSNSICVLV